MKNRSTEENIILAIDTSCDETSVAIVKGLRVISSVVSSQVELHKKWGGVVPIIARNAHHENLEPAYKQVLKNARTTESEIDFVAVTQGPGLALALEQGVEFAKSLCKRLNIPFIPVNHMEGHLFSSLILNRSGNRSNGQWTMDNGQLDLESSKNKHLINIFPALGLLVSGKNTEILLVKGIGDYQLLGETLDDAAGEAFDKVARMIDLGYPGGQIIDILGQRYFKNNPNSKKNYKELLQRFHLTIPMLKSDDLNFSYSGVKTACLYEVKRLRESGKSDKEWSLAFCGAFNMIIAKSITMKIEKALDLYPEVKHILTGGGVINNSFVVRDLLSLTRRRKIKVLFPEKKYRGDNAGMIGFIAGMKLQNNLAEIVEVDKLDSIDRKPVWEMGKNDEH